MWSWNKAAITRFLFVLIAVFAHHRHLAYAYGNGAPLSACPTMRPQHGAIEQRGPPPYKLAVSAEEVLPSQTLTIKITGEYFKGFMVTAFSSDFPVGTMISTDPQLSQVICNGASITQSSRDKKKEVTFQWVAPSDLLDGTLIDFKATMVKERLEYWMSVLTVEPLVYITTPPDLPPAGPAPGGDNTTTTGPGGVLPIPGRPLPATPTMTSAQRTTRATPNGADSNKFPGHLPVDAECGKSKACFHDCHSGQCTFIISWNNVDQDDLLMFMAYRLPDANEHWIAVGFSKDQEMGDDSVTECIMQDGEVKIQQSYNQGLDNKYLDNKKAALSEQTGRVENGLLTCSFQRKKKYPREPLIFDLNDDYFLLVAFGEGLNGKKMPHTFDVLPPVSDHRIDLQGMENVQGEEPPVSRLVQLHGGLMVISWVALTSIGIMTAKYGKLMFPKINPCGANIWFQIHRGCMMLVGVMTLIGVVLMVVQCEGYCQIPQMPGKSHWPLHPPLGILVLLLTIANPIVAFFRPAPKAPNRYVFAWSHWGVGVLAWIMASLAIFIGLSLERAHAPPEAIHVMVAWGVYHMLILVVMETLPRPLSKLYSALAEKTLQRGRVYNLERAQQDNLGYVAEDNNAEETPRDVDNTATKKEKADKKELTREELKVQRMLLMLHYGVVIILTFTLLLLLFLYTPPPP